MLLYEYVREFTITFTLFDYIELGLWILSMIIFALIAYSFFQHSREKNRMLIYPALFFFLYIIARIFRLIAKFVIGYPYGEYQFTGILFVLAVFYLIFAYTGLFLFYFFLERTTLNQTHYFFSGLVVVIIILSIVNYSIPIPLFILFTLYLIMIFGVALFYLYIASQSMEDARTRALLITAGLVFIAIGSGFDAPTVVHLLGGIDLLRIIMKFGAPLLLIFGALFVRRGYK